MAGFFAELKQNLDNVDVFYLDSLSYTQHFLAFPKYGDKNANKLVLLCKEVCLIHHPSYTEQYSNRILITNELVVSL